MSKWCTVTVTDPDGRRHSIDVVADSTFDAAHLFVVEAKRERSAVLAKPTLSTVFEVVAGGKVYRVTGAALQRWIVDRRQRLNGPKDIYSPNVQASNKKPALPTAAALLGRIIAFISGVDGLLRLTTGGGRAVSIRSARTTPASAATAGYNGRNHGDPA